MSNNGKGGGRILQVLGPVSSTWKFPPEELLELKNAVKIEGQTDGGEPMNLTLRSGAAFRE